jgi:hypothetical protein
VDVVISAGMWVFSPYRGVADEQHLPVIECALCLSRCLRGMGACSPERVAVLAVLTAGPSLRWFVSRAAYGTIAMPVRKRGCNTSVGQVVDML